MGQGKKKKKNSDEEGLGKPQKTEKKTAAAKPRVPKGQKFLQSVSAGLAEKPSMHGSMDARRTDYLDALRKKGGPRDAVPPEDFDRTKIMRRPPRDRGAPQAGPSKSSAGLSQLLFGSQSSSSGASSPWGNTSETSWRGLSPNIYQSPQFSPENKFFTSTPTNPSAKRTSPDYFSTPASKKSRLFLTDTPHWPAYKTRSRRGSTRSSKTPSPKSGQHGSPSAKLSPQSVLPKKAKWHEKQKWRKGQASDWAEGMPLSPASPSKPLSKTSTPKFDSPSTTTSAKASSVPLKRRYLSPPPRSSFSVDTSPQFKRLRPPRARPQRVATPDRTPSPRASTPVPAPPRVPTPPPRTPSPRAATPVPTPSPRAATPVPAPPRVPTPPQEPPDEPDDEPPDGDRPPGGGGPGDRPPDRPDDDPARPRHANGRLVRRDRGVARGPRPPGNRIRERPNRPRPTIRDVVGETRAQRDERCPRVWIPGYAKRVCKSVAPKSAARRRQRRRPCPGGQPCPEIEDDEAYFDRYNITYYGEPRP